VANEYSHSSSLSYMHWLGPTVLQSAAKTLPNNTIAHLSTARCPPSKEPRSHVYMYAQPLDLNKKRPPHHSCSSTYLVKGFSLPSPILLARASSSALSSNRLILPANLSSTMQGSIQTLSSCASRSR